MDMKADIEVKLVSCTPEPERHIETCGREAYGSTPSSDIEDVRNWIRKRIQGWEHDVLEHSVATFHITCSRVVSHELVRHRLASYTQKSMRFTEQAVQDFIIPPEVEDKLHQTWFQSRFDRAYEDYEYARKALKYPRQTARYVLPNMTATTIMMTANFRELRHVVTMRAAKMAQPEMRVVAQRIWEECIKIAPSVFDDLATELDKRGWL
jgi:thymidylate synthase (FAD)